MVHGRIPSGAETLQLSTGTLTVTGAVSIGSANLFGGTLTNSNGNSGTLTVTGPGSDWRGSLLNSSAGGNLGLIVDSSADLLISTAADHDFNGSAITNNGTLNWTGGNLRSGSGGVITNNGVFNDSAGAVVNNAYGGTSLVFTNAATGNYSKTNSGTTRFDAPFNNNGTTSVTDGTLQLNGGGTNTKTFTTGPTGTINLSADYALTDGSVISGAGAFKATAGTFTVSGNVTVAGLDLAGATLAGTQTFNGALTWTGGSLNSAGTTTLAPGATLAITPNSGGGAFDHDFNGRAIVNNGTVNWQAGAGQLRSGSGGTFTNNAAFNDSASSVVNSAYGGASLLFTNSGNGTYTKSASGTTRFDTPLRQQRQRRRSRGHLSAQCGRDQPRERHHHHR